MGLLFHLISFYLRQNSMQLLRIYFTVDITKNMKPYNSSPPSPECHFNTVTNQDCIHYPHFSRLKERFAETVHILWYVWIKTWIHSRSWFIRKYAGTVDMHIGHGIEIKVNCFVSLDQKIGRGQSTPLRAIPHRAAAGLSVPSQVLSKSISKGGAK